MIPSVIAAIAAALSALIAWRIMENAKVNNATIEAKLDGTFQTKLDNLADDVKDVKATQNVMSQSKERDQRENSTDMSNLRERIAILEFNSGIYRKKDAVRGGA